MVKAGRHRDEDAQGEEISFVSLESRKREDGGESQVKGGRDGKDHHHQTASLPKASFLIEPEREQHQNRDQERQDVRGPDRPRESSVVATADSLSPEQARHVAFEQDRRRQPGPSVSDRDCAVNHDRRQCNRAQPEGVSPAPTEKKQAADGESHEESLVANQRTERGQNPKPSGTL